MKTQQALNWEDMVQEPEALHQIKILIYGPSGFGKTSLIGSAMLDPRLAPVVVLDYEGGTSVLRGSGAKVLPIRSWEDFSSAYQMLAEGNHPFKTVAIDSLSEAHIFALLDRLDNRPNRKNTETLDMQDYGTAQTQLRRLMRMFRDLPYHFIGTALANEITDIREGTVKVPAMQGKLATEVLGLFDVVAYLGTQDNEETGEVDRVLVLKNYPKIKTKIRVPWMLEGMTVPDELINASLGDLATLILGSDDMTTHEIKTNGHVNPNMFDTPEAMLEGGDQEEEKDDEGKAPEGELISLKNRRRPATKAQLAA